MEGGGEGGGGIGGWGGEAEVGGGAGEAGGGDGEKGEGACTKYIILYSQNDFIFQFSFSHLILKMCDILKLQLLLNRSRLLSSFIGLTLLKYAQWSQLTIMSQNNQSINQAYLIHFLFKIWIVFLLLFPSLSFLVM